MMKIKPNKIKKLNTIMTISLWGNFIIVTA